MRTHTLKTLPKHFENVLKGVKKFEVRYNDRDFNADDTLILQEYWHGKYTGRALSARVPYILDDDMYCKEGYVIMSLENVAVLSERSGEK